VDTRTKILQPEDAFAIAARLRAGGWKFRLAVGTFDVLLAEHARQLDLLNDPDAVLLAAVVNTPDPILSLRARAEMVAALSSVYRVFAVEPGPPLHQLVTALLPDDIAWLESQDQMLLRCLIKHVHERHGR
jgi:hypothetical protein